MPDSAVRAFGRWIIGYDWLEITSITDVNAQCECFYKSLHSAIDTYFPVRKVKLHTDDKPWMTPYLKELIRVRQDTYSNGHHVRWRELRNKVQKEVFRAKREYYFTRVQRMKRSNPGAWYRQIRILTGRQQGHPPISVPDVDPSDLQATADAINGFFVAIVSD